MFTGHMSTNYVLFNFFSACVCVCMPVPVQVQSCTALYKSNHHQRYIKAIIMSILNQSSKNKQSCYCLHDSSFPFCSITLHPHITIMADWA